MTSRSAHLVLGGPVLILFAVSAMSGPARAGESAGEQVRLAVLGGDTPGAREQVVRVARAVLTEQGMAVAEAAPVTPRLASALRSCYGRSAPDACKEVAAASAGVSHVLAVDLGDQAAPPGGPASVTAWLVDNDGRVVVAERRYCAAPCAARALGETTRGLVQFVVRESLETAIHSVIQVRSTPTGARVSVDGRPVGVTEVAYTVYPGRHQVSVDKPGYRVETREVTAVRGATVQVDLALDRQEAATRHGGVWPWVLGGVGVAAMAGGVTLMALDSPKEGHGGQQRRYQSSFWPGVALTAAGAALVGGGMWMWLRHPTRAGTGARDPSEVAPPVGLNFYKGRVWVFGSTSF